MTKTLISDCTDYAFCTSAGGCDECQPEVWRTLQAGLDRWRLSSIGAGADAGVARWSVREMADLYRGLAEELDRACASGWRLYDVDETSGIRLTMGRVKT